MDYTVPPDIAERNRRFHILASSTHFEPRSMVLHWVCELEFCCAQLLFCYFEKQGTSKTWDDAEKELFGENGLLSSLTRMTRIASFLNILDEDEAADLRRLARLRNMYAHSRDRYEFNLDPKASPVVRSLVLFKQSPALEKHDEQGIFMSCCTFLKSRLEARIKALASGAA